MTHVIKYTKNVTMHFEITRNLLKQYIKSMDFAKNGSYKALDIGCGSGHLLRDVLYPELPKNCEEIVAIDKDKDMIEYCKKLDVDPKFHFHNIDLDTEQLPDNFKNKFDVLFSNYCFHHSRNMRQGLTNCYNMLKPQGEILFIFPYPGNPVYRIYKKLCKKDLWKPYFGDFEDYVPFLSGNDRDSELKDTFEGANIKVLAHEFRPELHEATRQQWLDLFNSMDFLHHRVPEDKKELYRKTYERFSIKEYRLPMNLDPKTFDLNETLRTHLNLAIVYGKKMQ